VLLLLFNMLAVTELAVVQVHELLKALPYQ
jgi:hypothetical protein